MARSKTPLLPARATQSLAVEVVLEAVQGPHAGRVFPVGGGAGAQSRGVEGVGRGAEECSVCLADDPFVSER